MPYPRQFRQVWRHRRDDDGTPHTSDLAAARLVGPTQRAYCFRYHQRGRGEESTWGRVRSRNDAKIVKKTIFCKMLWSARAQMRTAHTPHSTHNSTKIHIPVIRRVQPRGTSQRLSKLWQHRVLATDWLIQLSTPPLYFSSKCYPIHTEDNSRECSFGKKLIGVTPETHFGKSCYLSFLLSLSIINFFFFCDDLFWHLTDPHN